MLQAALIVAYGGFLESASPCKALKFELKQSCYGVVESNKKLKKCPVVFSEVLLRAVLGAFLKKKNPFWGLGLMP